ncbi:hypothetical protein Q5752_003518 [Cryptotrichosporon argae]
MFRQLVVAALAPALVLAGNANEWRSRSIYQLLTDRFAPVSADAPARTSPLAAECDAGDQVWCGGTWLSIIDKLDYIQGMGMDAVWISPVSQNIDVLTPYNYAYHGYWVDDPTALNPRFGTHADLLALSDALHARGMWLMVDIVVNNIPALSTNDSTNTTALAADTNLWTLPEYFHEFCWIDYSNTTSVEYCWLGDDKVALMDVNTEHPHVISTLEAWIANLTATYSIDGLRIDAAKHIAPAFWPRFCNASGVFCIGEVYTSDIGYGASFQTDKVMDSILGYPLYYGIVDGFGTPGGNMSGFVEIANQVLTEFPDPSVLGNFIENHDLPRWRNATADPQLAYNAMCAQFMFDGIPVVYYGQEQDFDNGAADPYNRAALWPSNYTNTSTYNHIKRLNQIRQAVINNGTTFNGKTFLNSTSQIVANTTTDVAIRKGPLLSVLTNRGSPSQAASFAVMNTGFSAEQTIIDLLTCNEWTTSSGGAISISYSAPGFGGMPYIFATQQDAATMGFCGTAGITVLQSSNTTASAASARLSSSLLPWLVAAPLAAVLL